MPVVEGGAEQINDLITLAQGLGLPSGTANSLIVKLQGAASALDRGNMETACGNLGAFLNEVNAQTGKKITADQAAQMIADLIIQMKTKTSHAVEAIQKGIKRVEDGKILTAKATVTFESIFKELEDILDEIERITHSAREMAEKNESVINMVSGIATISEQSMASTQEVSATAEEQSAAAQQVSNLSENLTGIANMLRESVAVFGIQNDNIKS